MIFVWMLLGVVVAVVALFVVLAQLGRAIPVEHTATSIIRIGAPAAQVFQTIADIESFPIWAKGITDVELMPDKEGMQVVRMRQGRNSFVLVRTRFDPPKYLERTITDDHKMFSGTWVYKVSGAPSTLPGREGCEVSLTETGRVDMPVARAMMKYIFGYHMYTNRHLESLAAKFGARERAHRG